MFKKIINFLFKSDDFVKTATSCFLIFLSLSIIFPAGSFTESTQVEVCAGYYADVASNMVNDSRHHSALLVESKDEKKHPMINTYTEFHALYGTFREDRAAFAGTVNSNRENTVYFKDIVSTDNLAFLYYQSGSGTQPYKEAYKHEYYPLQLMFEGNRDDWYKKAYSFMSISQAHADAMLDYYEKQHTPENYKWLTGQTIVLTMNDIDYTWMIDNIYLQTNYFYEDVYGVIGDFLFAYGIFPSEFKKQSLYFMCDQEFQNEYYINYAKKQYDSSNYTFKFATHNLKSGVVLDNKIMDKAANQKNETGTILLCLLSILIGIAALVYIYVVKLFRKWQLCLFLLIPLFLPYLIFKLLFYITKSPLLFSSFAVVFNMVSVLMVIVSILIFIFIHRIVIQKKEGHFNEKPL